MNIEAAFLDCLVAAGLGPVKFRPVADGRLHRFRVERDKAGSQNGWCVLYSHPVAHGAFGSWRTGETRTWRAESERTPTPAELAEQRRQLEAMRRQRADEEARMHEAARVKATCLWQLARPADAEHPYLTRKSVKAWGVRQLRDSLVIPARDCSGQIHTLQFIGPDGSKRFLSGGRIRAYYCAIGRPADTLLLAEGYATAATLYEVTGYATACAFNAGNLKPVALALRDKFPDLRIIVCADNDTMTPGNPGLAYALKAARAVRGWLAFPTFKESGDVEK